LNERLVPCRRHSRKFDGRRDAINRRKEYIESRHSI